MPKIYNIRRVYFEDVIGVSVDYIIKLIGLNFSSGCSLKYAIAIKFRSHPGVDRLFFIPP